MSVRIALVVTTLAVGALVAFLLDRRRPAAPTRGADETPRQLDRADFPGGGVPFLLVVFSSATCASCVGVVEMARAVASPVVEVFEAELTTRRDLHDRYGITSVPTTVVAEAEGVVQAAWVGSIGPGELAAAITGLSRGASSPEG